jgi:hypothetical protein
MKPNPYQQLQRDPLPGGRAREVLEDLRSEDPNEEEEETDGDH